ncbi:MAG: hypothetical protein AAFX94_12250 [Myxococcota bacterium]
MDLSAHIPTENLSSHTDRLLASLRAVGDVLGADHSLAASQWLEHWGQLVPLEGDVEAAQDTHRRVGQMMPCFAELVFTLRGNEFQAAWMSGGRNGAHLAETVASLLHSTVTAHLMSGGDRRRAELMAELFAAAFPNLQRLREMSALAQVFLVGVAPDSEGHTLKVYLNPRVSSGDPVSHLRRIAESSGADGVGFADLVSRVYRDRGRTAKLYGVGVDLAENRPARIKLYVRVSRDETPFVLGEMGASDALMEFLQRFDHPALTENVELALALVDGKISAKATQFWSGKAMDEPQEREALDWLSKAGFATTPIQRAFDRLRAPRPPTVQRSPLHAIGIETTHTLKANVYAQPEL